MVISIALFQDSGGVVVDDINSTMSNNQYIFGCTANASVNTASTYGNASPTITTVLRNTGTQIICLLILGTLETQIMLCILPNLLLSRS